MAEVKEAMTETVKLVTTGGTGFGIMALIAAVQKEIISVVRMLSFDSKKCLIPGKNPKDFTEHGPIGMTHVG
jgi:hypothetical protein